MVTNCQTRFKLQSMLPTKLAAKLNLSRTRWQIINANFWIIKGLSRPTSMNKAYQHCLPTNSVQLKCTMGMILRGMATLSSQGSPSIERCYRLITTHAWLVVRPGWCRPPKAFQSLISQLSWIICEGVWSSPPHTSRNSTCSTHFKARMSQLRVFLW